MPIVHGRTSNLDEMRQLTANDASIALNKSSDEPCGWRIYLQRCKLHDARQQSCDKDTETGATANNCNKGKITIPVECGSTRRDSVSTKTGSTKILGSSSYFGSNSFCCSVSSFTTSSAAPNDSLDGNGKRKQDKRHQQFSVFKGLRSELCARMPLYWLVG